MKNTLRQVFHSGKFVFGFAVFVTIILTLIIYPLFNPGDPLKMIGLGTFFKPGTYVSLYDSVGVMPKTLKLEDATDNRLAQVLSDVDKISMVTWLTATGVPNEEIDMTNVHSLVATWNKYFSPTIKPKGMTMAQRNFYSRLDGRLKSMQSGADITIAAKDATTGTLTESGSITATDYVNLNEVANIKVLPLGTDNFGRDVLKELVSACGTSIMIGLIAGLIATTIGLLLGLLAGYLGGIVDDIIMFFTNIFTVIPSIVLLILIAYSINQDQRGAVTVAMVIGFTSWVWTTRSVRSQVISLRNRDHVNLSKLSGHSVPRIILTDILPYIASYVVMAFILQISSGILAEATLSMLGLGPKTTEVPTLGLMMSWSMLYSAHINGAWWAYFPVILTIALISFSLNLMNTGLDQVFNPTLRD